MDLLVSHENSAALGVVAGDNLAYLHFLSPSRPGLFLVRFHFVCSFDDFCVLGHGRRGDTAEAAACLRPGPGQTGKVTPVSSSETVHRRRWVAVSWDCPPEWASSG